MAFPRTFDFHLHTSASDGTAPAHEARCQAGAAGLSGISITDHDTVDAYAGLESAPPEGPRILHGIEISTRLGDEEAHILGYFPRGACADLRAYAESLIEARNERISEGITRLRERGVDISWKECAALATGRVVSRSVLARALQLKRYVGKSHRAYVELLGPSTVPLPGERALDAVERIRSLGGVSVWAHPGTPQLEKHLDTLTEAGLEGVEAYIPRRSARERREVVELAQARSLFVTGGSDWHGAVGRPRLGTFRVVENEVAAFLERIGWS